MNGPAKYKEKKKEILLGRLKEGVVIVLLLAMIMTLLIFVL
jgi:hypothetical protein